MTNQDYFTDELYNSTKIENGKYKSDYFAVFSLTVLSKYRGMGIGQRLLLNLIKELRASENKGIVLACSKENISYYEKFGFIYKGISKSVVAGEIWYDMVYYIDR